MVRMNFILPIKMAISHQVLSLGGGGGGGGGGVAKRKNITEPQYCTGMSRREIKK